MTLRREELETGAIEVRPVIADAVFLLGFVGSYFVTHAYAVRISRALESGGRLRGRGTIVLWAGPLAITNIVVVLGVSAALDIPVMESRSAGAWKVALSGVLPFPVAWTTGTVVLAAVRMLPARRRAGPHRRLNAILGALAQGLAKAAFPVVTAVLVGALIAGLRKNPPGHDAGEWVAIVVVVPLSAWAALLFAVWIHTAMSAYAERLRSPSSDFEDHGGWTLYLRPFDEEHRLFAGSQTLEQFLHAEVGDRVGPLVALGNPTDRVSPEGAERRYYTDASWQSAVERLALRAACIVGVTGASASTAWELKRIRELELEHRLFLVSPPCVEAKVSLPAVTAQPPRARTALKSARDLVKAYLNDDTAEISRLMSFGKLPGAWSPAGLTAWPDFVSVLCECGYAVEVEDPGRGAVLGFQQGGRAIVLARGRRTPAEYVEPIVSSLASHARDERGPAGDEQT